MANSEKIGNRQEFDEFNRNNTDSYSQSLRRHNRRKRISFTLIIVLVIAIAGGIMVYNNTVKYEEYTVVKSLDIDDGAGSQYVPFGDFFIKYGLDGVSYINGKETIWSQAYEMSKPIVDVCEEYAAVADKGTNTIYVFDNVGSKGTITTSYPIVSIEVANQGVVAALLEENTSNYIEVYNQEGELLISHKTILNGNGYPLGFSLSDDGTKMIVSYVCINSGVMESKVLFYNFSDVGQNEVDRMVGGFNHYKSTVIPRVKFLSNNTAIAIGDDVLSIYKMKEKPSLENEIEIKDEIKKVFYSEDYIGLVFNNTNGNNKYKVKVYNLSGKLVMDQSIDMEFDTIKFSGKNILVYNDMNCKVISFKGKTRFEYGFKESVVDIMTTDKFKEYLIITNNTVKRIRIK